MPLRIGVVLFAACCAAVDAAAQVPPSREPAGAQIRTATIRGRVVVEAPGLTAPIHDARISINPGGATDPVFTDEAGRFELRGLTAGRYTLTAEKTGFAKTRYGSKSDLDPPVPVDVGDGAVVDGIQINMPRGAAIAGRIVDDVGDPVVGAGVRVGLLQIVGTEMRLVAVSRPASATDDRGEYRIGGLAAGRYYLSVASSIEGSPIAGAPVEWNRTISWVRTFYQNASTLADAIPIVLGPGEERGGVDLTLVPSRPAKLTLSLTDATGAPVEGLINLFLPGDSPGSVVANRGVPLSPGNPRMTPTLEPGEWVAVALPRGGGRSIAHVKLSSGDETSLTLTLGSGARIAGRVVFEGSSSRPALTSMRLGVRGVGLDTGTPAPGLSNGLATVRPDGTFEIAGVVGTIELQPASPLRGWTLRAVKYGDRDLLDAPLMLSGNEAISGVQVVFTDQLAEVAGTAVDSDGRPSPGCTVVLLSDNTDLWFGSRRTRLVRADQNGRFLMSDLLSGSYLLAATPDVSAADWLTSDYLRRLQPATARVTLTDREQKAMTIPCVSVP